MVNNLSLFLLLMIGTFSSNAQNKLEETLNLKFYSSKQKSFNVSINSKSNLIKLTTDKIVYVADSISTTPSFSKMDDNKVKLINQFIRSSDNFYKLVDSETKIKLFNILKKLNSCSKNINSTDSGGLMYISYDDNYLKDEKYCQYIYNKLETNSNDSSMREFLVEIEKIFSDNSLAKSFLNSTKVYFNNRSFEVLSTNPLYVKFYNIPPYHYPIYTSCEKLEEQIKDLPNAAEIFIDITEFQGNYEKCVEELLYKKFKHLNWIQNSMFDTFNSSESKK